MTIVGKENPSASAARDAFAKLTLVDWIGGLMFVVGIVAGPVYYFYCESFSGRAAGEYQINKRDNAYPPLSLTLDPEMNPIILWVSGSGDGHEGDSPTWLRLSLLDGKARLLTESIGFSLDKDSRGVHLTQSLGQISVPRAAQYAFVVETSHSLGRSVAVSDLRLTVKRNARVPNMRIVWSGVGLLVVGLLLGFMSGSRPEET